MMPNSRQSPKAKGLIPLPSSFWARGRRGFSPIMRIALGLAAVLCLLAVVFLCRLSASGVSAQSTTSAGAATATQQTYQLSNIPTDGTTPAVGVSTTVGTPGPGTSTASPQGSGTATTVNAVRPPVPSPTKGGKPPIGSGKPTGGQPVPTQPPATPTQPPVAPTQPPVAPTQPPGGQPTRPPLGPPTPAFDCLRADPDPKQNIHLSLSGSLSETVTLTNCGGSASTWSVNINTYGGIDVNGIANTDWLQVCNAGNCTTDTASGSWDQTTEAFSISLYNRSGTGGSINYYAAVTFTKGSAVETFTVVLTAD